jgi:hypothetical protein
MRLAGTVNLKQLGLSQATRLSNPTELFVRQPPDCATDNEDRDLAIVPHHQVRVCHLTMPHLGTKRLRDSASAGNTMFGVDLLNSGARS